MKRPILASLSTYATLWKEVQNSSLSEQLTPTLWWSLVGKLRDLLAYSQLSKAWVAFGMGYHFSVTNINGTCSSLESLSLKPYQSFTFSLGVTVLRSSVLLAERQLGEHGY